MTVLYADPSALVRAYLGDEAQHEGLRALLLESDERVITSEISRVEHASAIRAALAAGRITDARSYLDLFDRDSGVDGRIALVALHPDTIFRSARELALEHHLRALDAIHLAVALDHRGSIPGDNEIVLVTRDAEQAAAASALGLTVR